MSKEKHEYPIDSSDLTLKSKEELVSEIHKLRAELYMYRVEYDKMEKKYNASIKESIEYLRSLINKLDHLEFSKIVGKKPK